MALPTRVRRDDTNSMEQAQREFEGMLGRFFNGAPDGGQRLAPYAVDVREDADHIYVDAELPGFQKDDVDVTLENQTLTIAAQRKDEKQEGGGAKSDWLLRERRYSRFLRSFTLPPTVNEQSVNAKLLDGVLTITLDKREETKPRRFQVS